MKKLSIILACLTLLPTLRSVHNQGFENKEWIKLIPTQNHWSWSKKKYQLSDFQAGQNIYLHTQFNTIVNAYISEKNTSTKSLKVIYDPSKTPISAGNIIYLKPAREDYQYKTPQTRALFDLYDSHPTYKKTSIAFNKCVLAQFGSDCGFHALWNAKAMIKQNFTLMQNTDEFELFIDKARFFLEGTHQENILTNIFDFYITAIKDDMPDFLNQDEKERIVYIGSQDLQLVKNDILDPENIVTQAFQDLTNSKQSHINPYLFIINPINLPVGQDRGHAGWHWIAIAFYRENDEVSYQIADSLGSPTSYTYIADNILKLIKLFSGPGSIPPGFRETPHKLTEQDINWLKEQPSISELTKQPLQNARWDRYFIQDIRESRLSVSKKVVLTLKENKQDINRRGIITKTIFYPENTDYDKTAEPSSWISGLVTITYMDTANNPQTWEGTIKAIFDSGKIRLLN